MVRVIRWILVGVRWVAPWLVRLVGLMFRLAVGTLAVSWVGVPTAIRRIAYEWQIRAVNSGLPTAYEQWLYYGACVVAGGMIVAGWIVTAYLTVFLLGVIF